MKRPDCWTGWIGTRIDGVRGVSVGAGLLLLGLMPRLEAGAGESTGAGEATFYVPADPAYTIVESVRDSLRFTVDKTLKEGDCGHLVSISSFVNPEGEIMGWHDFGNLEGPGWAANAVGGAHEIYLFGWFLRHRTWPGQAVRILDHVLGCGFLDEETGFIRGYRETTSGKLCLNYKHNSDWFCPGSMAKVAYQLLVFADSPLEPPRPERMRRQARLCAEWIEKHVEPVPNGWFPRRTTPEGKIYRRSPEGGNDPFWQTSADGLFILQLQAALTERGLADYRESLRRKTRVFIEAGGIFGSINHDTYDPHENVAYSVAFRTLRLIARVLEDPAIRAFAFDQCLAGLDQFKMTEDRNGVATRGLLYMEKSWDTAYLWENAEAALAYFEAAHDLRGTDPGRSRQFERDGLVILRAIGKHHYGPHGFLTEGVDWNNHVGQRHHINQAEFGAIQYTEPFLNNQHIAEPTLFHLRHLAQQAVRDGTHEWRDLEGNVIYAKPSDLPSAKSQPLWDGRTFNGWHRIGKGEWAIIDGAIRGRNVAGEPEYGHLVTDRVYRDFVVRLKYKAVKGNSGLYFRIEETGFSGVSGFQAEIDAQNDAGGLYETNGRGWVVQPKPEDVRTWFKPGEWNEMTVTAFGRDIRVEVNGKLSAQVLNDPGRLEGRLALQVHGGQDVEVWFKDLEIGELRLD